MKRTIEMFGIERARDQSTNMAAATLILTLSGGGFAAQPPKAPAATPSTAQTPADPPANPNAAATAADHTETMAQLGVTRLRPGPSGNEAAPNHANYDEALANRYPTLPDPLTLKNGRKVTSAEIWWKQRRPEIVEDFDREGLGRVPKHAPSVTWRVNRTELTEFQHAREESDSGPADRAVPRTDANSIAAHAQLLEKAKKGKIDVYFVGDSIVRRWGALDYPELLANWNQNFHGWNAANFGWGGDRTQNILWRLENGELDGVDPKVVVILAGTNNIGAQPRDERTAGEIARGVRAIVDVCQKRAPKATIVLTAIFPRNDIMGVMPTIDRINQQLATFADGPRVRFLNINDRLADGNGRLVDGLLNERDKLHPTLEGYQIWADALKPIFEELLGPPAATDLAPPPTGDPSRAGSRSIR
jgi:lysophospholipase L1-like esterase